MDKEKIKDALDKFENDKFKDSKDILSTEIGKVKDKFIKNKLGLKDWGNPPENSEEE